MARVFNSPLLPGDPAVAAEAAKTEGNEAFKSGDYGLVCAFPALSLPHGRPVDLSGGGQEANGARHGPTGATSPCCVLVQAVTHYTTSLAAKPTAVTFANRAMARLKLGQHAEAEADCTQASPSEPFSAGSPVTSERSPQPLPPSPHGRGDRSCPGAASP